MVRVVECGGKGILRAAVVIAEFSVERNEQADLVARFEIGIFRFDFFALVGAVVGEGIFRPEDLCLCFFDEHGKRTRLIVVVCRGDDIVDGVRDGRAFRIHFDVFEEGGGLIVYGERPVRFLIVYGGRIVVHVVQNHPVFAVVGERKVLERLDGDVCLFDREGAGLVILHVDDIVFIREILQGDLITVLSVIGTGFLFEPDACRAVGVFCEAAPRHRCSPLRKRNLRKVLCPYRERTGRR